MKPETAGSGLSKTSSALSSLNTFVQQYGTKSVASMFPGETPPKGTGSIDMTRFYVVDYASPVDAFTAAAEISGRPEVEYAEPWFIYSVDGSEATPPNDSFFSHQWYLQKIQMESAWAVSQGDTNVVLGIVDTGVQLDHPDLAANIWTNPGETGLDAHGNDKSTNGIDDDGDGAIDDVHGWDLGGADFNAPAPDNNPAPTDTNNSHGTHVSGIACAVTNNSRGIAGVGVKCKIMAVKTSADNDYRDNGGAYIIAGYEGIAYAARAGATVINCSWGGNGFARFEQDMIDEATQLGALVVAAAGNGNGGAHPDPLLPVYPGSYNHVISVAATASNDVKTYYTSYGTDVDVCAPGGIPTFNGDDTQGILSTLYPSTYAVAAGTSQATPQVTGLAGLVASHFPAFTNLQIGEQIRVTCDDISAQNPTFYPLLGKGRINAYRALTDVTSPALRMTSYIVRDSLGGNNNSVPEPNETVDLVMTFTNYLRPTSPAAVVTLSSSDTNAQVAGAVYPIGLVGTMGTATNAAAPFTIHINPNAPNSTNATLKLSITDGSYADVQYFNLFIYPTYATHDINDIKTTLTNNGNIGFYDFPDNTKGEGFIFSGANQLYEAGLLIGYSPARLVDVVRNQSGGQDLDFTSSQVYRLQTPGIISDQDGSTLFTDDVAAAANKVGVEVKSESYAFSAPADRDYVIVRYDIKNTSGATLSNLYAGIFADWDVIAPGSADPSYFDHNRTSFDASRSLGYQWYDTSLATTYCGIRALDGAAGYAALVRDSISATRAEKWSWLSGGVRTKSSVEDFHFVVSSGPYTLNAGATKTVGFALIGGTDLPGLQTSADAASTKWSYIQSTIGARPKLSIAIHQNPVVTQHADLFVNTDIPLSSAPSMFVSASGGGNTAVPLTLITQNLYSGSYEFGSNGLRSINVTAIGTNGLDTAATRQFTVVLAKQGVASSIRDPDNEATLNVTASALSGDTYLTASPEGVDGPNPFGISNAYAFGPEVGLSAPVSLNLRYASLPRPADPRYLHVYQRKGQKWVPLESWVDTKRQLIGASISSLGTFAVGYDAHSLSATLPSAYALFQNYPNPFNPQTTIRFALPEAGRVRLRIFNLLGQQARELIDEDLDAGYRQVTWDGRSDRGEQVSSGVYAYTLEVLSGNKSAFKTTGKMVVIR
jgi:subtilisin family serine protease